jgi:hypothetical protein
MKSLFHVLVLAVSAGSLQAQPCVGVDQKGTPKLKRSMAASIALHSPGTVRAEAVHITGFMQEGGWALAFATPPGAERGVFFFALHEGVPRFVSAWGGVAGPDTSSSIASWTTTLDPNFPASLASCFADAVVSGK